MNKQFELPHWLHAHLYSELHTHFADELTLDSLGDVEGQAILDLGCGDGRQSAILASRGAEISGLDRDPQAIEAARARIPERQDHFICADAMERLPYRDRSFSAVLASLLLHYLRDWDGVLAECMRILKPGGELILSIQHPFSDFVDSGSSDYYHIESWRPEGFGAEGDTLTFWRRPLESILTSVRGSGLVETDIVEPAPSRPYPQARNSALPRLLIVKAIRPVV